MITSFLKASKIEGKRLNSNFELFRSVQDIRGLQDLLCRASSLFINRIKRSTCSHKSLTVLQNSSLENETRFLSDFVAIFVPLTWQATNGWVEKSQWLIQTCCWTMIKLCTGLIIDGWGNIKSALLCVIAWRMAGSRHTWCNSSSCVGSHKASN